MNSDFAQQPSDACTTQANGSSWPLQGIYARMGTARRSATPARSCAARTLGTAGTPPSLFLTVIFLMLALIYYFVLRSAAVASSALVSDTPLWLLYSLMCVSFTALLATVQIMIDLSDPFSGTYSIDISPEAVGVAAIRVRGALEQADEAVDRASTRPSSSGKALAARLWLVRG